MTRFESVRLSFRLLKQRSSIVIFCVLILAFVWFGEGSVRLKTLYDDMSGDLVLYYAAPADLSGEWNRMLEEGRISGWSEYKTARVTLDYGGYSAEAVLEAFDRHYLSREMGVDFPEGGKGSMPYVLLDGYTLRNMKDSDGKAFPEEGDAAVPLQIFQVNGTEKVRILGLTETRDGGTEMDGGQMYAYTTIEYFNAIQETENGVVFFGADTGEENTGEITGDLDVETVKEEETLEYAVRLKDKFHLKAVMEEIESYGVTLDKQVQFKEQEHSWELQKTRASGCMQKFAVAFLCAFIFIRLQRKLWIKEHGAFLAYIRMNHAGTVNRVLRYWSGLYLLISMAAGIIPGVILGKTVL